MVRQRFFLLFLLCCLLVSPGFAQVAYKQPPTRVVEILDTPPTPILINHSRNGLVMLCEFTYLSDLKTLSQPMLRLAGLRIIPAWSAPQRFSFTNKITVKSIASGKEVGLQLPNGCKFSRPQWSPDGRKIALTAYSDQGVALWVYDPTTGQGKALTDPKINTILCAWSNWTPDSQALIVPTVVENRGPQPTSPAVPSGPTVDETSGKVSKLRTYQDLLKTSFDEDLFDYYARSQFVRVNVETGAKEAFGAPGLNRGIAFSPDAKMVLVNKIKRPFSRIVPEENFAQTTEIWDTNGKFVTTIADLPVADDLPIQGVPKGPRDIQWQPLMPATLIWTEALDGGDPNVKIDFREKIMKWSAPFAGKPQELFRIPQRFAGIQWLQEPGFGLFSDYDRDKKWITTRLFDTLHPVSADQAKMIFNRSVHDDYSDPGSPVYTVLPDGQAVVIYQKGWLFMTGDGATPNGDFPFLRKLNLATGASSTIFLCASGTFETFEGFVDDTYNAIITSFETAKQNPNYFTRVLKNEKAQKAEALTAFPDPAPELTQIRKERLSYKRDDGVPLSGLLYYPVNYKSGEKVPVVVWAYPLEYVDAKTAGQVRVTETRFPRLESSSVLFFLLHGYAVLYDAEIPVVGDPATANDTYIEQISAGAKAAVDALVAKGVCDRDQIGVSGHSYGANMVAHLLAHTDLFAAGIARSGAYNRSLTPFGFQGERRTFWEVPDIYLKLSPFTHAAKINEPLLLIHGELDDNPGTFPMQSERLLAAIRGGGGKARLVMLPYEAHGYKARESVLHVLAEMFDWFDAYVKAGRKPPMEKKSAVSSGRSVSSQNCMDATHLAGATTLPGKTTTFQGSDVHQQLLDKLQALRKGSLTHSGKK
ncbi:MAG: prolyl oligopeptidase family serine peptidase [Candidatus Ozemobacteraceae bacterium]